MLAETYHLVNTVLRFFFSFLFVYILLPRLLFKQPRGRKTLEAFFANLALMVFFSIALGYLLVLVRLFEVLALLIVYVAIMAWRWFSKRDEGQMENFACHVIKRFYDLLDGFAHPLGTFIIPVYRSALSARKAFARNVRQPAWVLEMLIWILVLGLSAYLRFLDALQTAAPAMSDSYVTLAWTKYIEQRELFHDGIYPQGYYIYLATLHKFTGLDAVHVLKLVGPWSGVLITLACYFTVSGLTRNRLAGLLASFTFGVLGPYLPLEFVRQGASNSQEFALVFLLPTLWFALQFGFGGQRRNLVAFFAGAAVIGLVHTMVAAFLLCGLLAAGASMAFTRTATRGRLCLLAGATGLAGLIWILPIGIGLVMGKAFHTSSVAFASNISAGVFTIPEISMLTGLALAGSILGTLYCLLRIQRKRLLAGALFSQFLVLGALFIYQAPRFNLKNAAMAARSGDFLAQAIPVGIGFLWFFIVSPFSKKKSFCVLTPVIALAVMAVALWQYPPKPAAPYKMQWEEEIKQYERINRDFRPTEWLMVSQEEGYALALGVGFHIMTGDFLGYNPMSANKLVYDREEGPGGIKRGDVLSSENILIFNQKKLYDPTINNNTIAAEMAPILKRRAREEQNLSNWLDLYKKNHPSKPSSAEEPEPYWETYFNNENIEIVLIRQPIPKKEKFRDIWGE